MSVTVLGDFADPLSFLASQRVDRILPGAAAEIRWLAVEADRSRPMAGRPLGVSAARVAADLALPGETVPDAEIGVPNSRAATAAYAESLTDGLGRSMRRALFEALWVERRHVDDAAVVQALAYRLINDDQGPLLRAARRRAGMVVPLNDDALATTRRLGFLVSPARGPLTSTGQHRVDAWRRLWLARGEPRLPLLLTELGEALAGPAALHWLAERLPQRAPQASPALRLTA